jgi:hypothetical protein
LCFHASAAHSSSCLVALMTHGGNTLTKSFGEPEARLMGLISLVHKHVLSETMRQGEG